MPEPLSFAEERDKLLADEAKPIKNFEAIHEKDTVKLSTTQLTVEVSLHPWEVSFYNSDEILLTKECTDSAKDKEPGFPPGFMGERTFPSGVGVYERKFTPSPGELGTKTIRSVNRTRERLLLAQDEHVYGFGEKYGSFDKMGRSFTLWNVDPFPYGVRTEMAYKNIPFFVSSNGYGVFINTSGRIDFDMGDKFASMYSFEIYDNELDYFFIYGPQPKKILQEYTELTGKPALPPKWSFGLWTSSFMRAGQKSEEDILAQINEMDERDLPVDVYNFDGYSWLRKNMLCDFVWDSERYPDPKETMKKVKDKDVKICLWENPYVSIRSKMFEEGAENGYFLKNKDGSTYITCATSIQPLHAIVDFTNPETIEWWKEKHRRLIDMGADTFKTDFGENIPPDACYCNGEDGEKMHNLYALLYNQATFEVVEQETENSIVWARSAWAGSQRFPTHWGGDSHCTFEDMKSTLQGGLNFMMSGMSFWSHDIGGFIGKPSRKLYIRWAQFGLLSPHARIHGETCRDPWEFGEETVEIFRKFDKLRYKLIPYLYSYAHESSEKGIPMMRPMVLEYPKDPRTHDLDTQYMLGDNLLVAPVFRKDDKKEVYLPKGKWKNYWTEETSQGPTLVRFDKVPLNELPLYVREDSIIPMSEELNRASKQGPPSRLYLYIEDKAEFTYQGDEQKIRFKAERTGDGIEITASESGTYTLIIEGEEKEIELEKSKKTTIKA